MQLFLQDLNRIYVSEPALYQIDFSWKGFEWIDFRDVDQSIISFIRKGENHAPPIIVIANFTPIPRQSYRIGLPQPGTYQELLNSDSAKYGGGHLGNQGAITAEEIPWQGQPYSAELTLPPLAVLYLRPDLAPEPAPE